MLKFKPVNKVIIYFNNPKWDSVRNNYIGRLREYDYPKKATITKVEFSVDFKSGNPRVFFMLDNKGFRYTSLIFRSDLKVDAVLKILEDEFNIIAPKRIRDKILVKNLLNL